MGDNTQLSVRQNLLETLHGGHPDRFVKQFEFAEVFFTPITLNKIGGPGPGMMGVKNAWGVTINWPEGQPGQFPDHSADKVVIKDIEHWRDYVHMPDVSTTDEMWEPVLASIDGIDRDETYIAPWVLPGLFEQCHFLGEIKNTLLNMTLYPDKMHELIDYLVEFELKEADEIITHLHPNALFHHDDWGTQTSTFMSPDMFAEFFLEPYKTIYGYYKDHGVELVIHHSDSYAATLVPYMIEMGIDIWQGVMEENDIPALLEKYKGQITFMGGINSAHVDYKEWTDEAIAAAVKKACDACGPLSFIPGTTMGEPHSLCPGVYEAVSDAIGAYSKTYWEEHNL